MDQLPGAMNKFTLENLSSTELSKLSIEEKYNFIYTFIKSRLSYLKGTTGEPTYVDDIISLVIDNFSTLPSHSSDNKQLIRLQTLIELSDENTDLMSKPKSDEYVKISAYMKLTFE